MQDLIEKFKTQFEILEVTQQKPSLGFIRVRKDQAEMFIRALRDHAGYTHLAFMTAIDYIEDGVFRLVYMLHNYKNHTNIGVHVDIPRDPAEMVSIHPLWAQAATYQRELREMFGIVFPGSPGLNDNFFLEGWEEIPPMRKEFDIVEYGRRTYEDRPGRQTHDVRENMAEQLYPVPEAS